MSKPNPWTTLVQHMLKTKCIRGFHDYAVHHIDNTSIYTTSPITTMLH